MLAPTTMTREVRLAMNDASSTPTAFGRLLRFWRGVFGRTQEDLAHELDSSPRHISRLENGRVQPSREMVERIAGCLELGDRDTAHLLHAAGYTSPRGLLDLRSADLRWLRRATAQILDALDPYPSLLTDGVSIHMVNRSWLGLMERWLDPPSATPTIRDYYDLLLRSMRSPDGHSTGPDIRCGFLMTLQQEALIRDDADLQRVVQQLAVDHELPPDWPARAARFEPTASFGVWIELEGESTLFFHVSRSISPAGPSHLLGAGMAILSLLPKDTTRDWSFLTAHDRDDPVLCTHALGAG